MAMTDSDYLDGDDNELIKALCHINYLEKYRENILHTCFYQYEKKDSLCVYASDIFLEHSIT